MTHLEFLETNGTGGFYCGAVNGTLRRKWHGFWTARKPPRDRARVIAGFEERVAIPGMKFPVLLGRVRDLKQSEPPLTPMFEPFPVPKWTWDLPDGSRLHKHIVLEHGSTSDLHVAYTCEKGVSEPDPEGRKTRIAIRPVMPMEGVWGMGGDCTARYFSGGNCVLRLSATKPAEFRSVWESYRQVVLEAERACEDVWTEDLFVPAELVFDLLPGETLHLCFRAGGGVRAAGDALAIAEKEAARRRSGSIPGLGEDYAHLGQKLAHAADQFIVTSGSPGLPTIIAGYPWFTDWGRDTMISLPGLCLATGRKDEAFGIIRHFMNHMNRGTIPNIFPEAGSAPAYNTVDATLWLVEAFFRVVPDDALTPEDPLWLKLRDVVMFYARGTHNDVRMDPADCLIIAGNQGAQLTWMDVKVNGEVPTPRHGKPVEIQALWYNALCHLERAARRMGDEKFADHCNSALWTAQDSFRTRFFDFVHEYPADVVDRDGPGTADFSLRPNMLIAFALRHNIVPKEERARILAAAQDLVTPRGLRTLGPKERAYKPRYEGNLLARDRAYHQGTVWMWPIYAYLKGVVAERKEVPELYKGAAEIVAELVHHFEVEGCMNQASEIFDAEPPHIPRGCFAQAWSVAALIESLRLGF